MKKQSNGVELTKEQKKKAEFQIQQYINENFIDEESNAIGNIEAALFLDYISEKIGIYYYNMGVADSCTFIADKTDDLYAMMKHED